MYAKQIQLNNLGPIDTLDIEFPFMGDNPKPVVLVGQNGSGKSILLAHLVNSLIKAKDMVYPETPEVQPGRVYKYKSNFYIKTGNEFSFSRVDLDGGWYVSELTTMSVKQDYSNVPPGILGTAAESMWRRQDSGSNDYSESNFDTSDAAFNQLRKVFSENCILYFPFNRFEEPAWLNKQNLTAQVEYVDRMRMVAHSDRQVVAMSPLQQNRNWLFDVMYDRRVPETRSVRVPIPMPGQDKPWYIEGEQKEKRDHDEKVMQIVLQIVRRVLRDDSNASFRLSRRGNRFVALHGDHGLLVPNIFQLSSGETSLLNLFLSILRDFEWSGSSFASTNDVRGIVVVDEIDLHLHAIHQSEILPGLIRTFPKVQFVVTSHSPLFVLGMQRAFGDDGFGLYHLPGGRQIDPEEFSEFREAYETYTSTLRFMEDTEKAVMETQRPVLLTEGKTDSKYLKKASELLGMDEIHQRFDVRSANGSPNLAKVWNSPKYELVPQRVLLLFDCDQNRPAENRGNLYQRTVPYQSKHPIKKGIENLFEKETLERASKEKPAFVDIEHEHARLERGVEAVVPENWTINPDEKTNLCDWLCENGTRAEFRHFQSIFDIMEKVVDA